MANTKIQSEQIEDGAITAAKIADGAIVASEVADNAITTAKINADAVTGAKIADNAIDSEHYTDGSIDTAHIADDQVTQAKMANDSVGADELASSAVVTASIVDDAVTSAKLDTNIDIAGTFDVTGAATLDSTLAVAGDANFDSGTLFVDVSANSVGIGETTPLASLHIKQGDSGLSSLNAAAHHLFLEDTGSNGPGITFASGTSSNCTLAFGDSDSNYQGFILYDNSIDALKFGAAGTGEKLRLRSNGYVDFTGAADLRVTFGSTGTAGNNDSNWVRGENSDLAFNAASGDHKWEVGGTPVARLDADGLRFGSNTATANALNAYEEGLATLAFATSDTQFTAGTNSDTSTYTRIGNQVTLFVSLAISSPSGGSGALRITGLPFTNTGPQVTTSDCSLGRMANSATQRPFGLLGNNSDVITFYYNVNGAVGAVFSATNLNGQVTPFINFTITYTT